MNKRVLGLVSGAAVLLAWAALVSMTNDAQDKPGLTAKPATWPDGARPLTTDGADEWGPVWSVDGSLIAYHTYQSASPDIFCLDPSSGKKSPVVAFNPNPTTFRWLDAGTRLVYERRTEGSRLGPTAGRLVGVSRQGGEVRTFETQGAVGHGWAVSGDGKRLVAAGYATQPDRHFYLRRFDPASGEFSDLGLTFPTGMWAVDEVAVSDDHALCALIAEPGRGRERDVYLVPLDSPDGRVRRLTDDGGEKRGLVWSPDGKRLAFLKKQPLTPAAGQTAGEPKAARRRGSGYALYLLPAGGGPAELALGGAQSVDGPSWHPSGGFLVCSAGYGKEWRLVAVEPGSKNVRELTRGAWRDFSPACSPDGSAVVFVSNRAGDLDLFRLEIKGERP
jgi:Tol biopolymer transport system component